MNNKYLNMMLAIGLAIPVATLTHAAETSVNNNKAGGSEMRMQNAVLYDQKIASVTAITEVFGDGQKLTAVAIEYRQAIKNDTLKVSDFVVANRNITRVYANNTAAQAKTGQNGHYVILELNANDANAATYNSKGPALSPASVIISQSNAIQAASGQSITASDQPVTNSLQHNLIVDDFQQFKFKDPKTGIVLNYNLYIPKQIGQSKKQPLVLFMHDLGVTGPNPYATLTQGKGAVAWASPDAQKKHASFVLAPQYPAALANDNNQTSIYADITVRLIEDLQKRYPIDSKRLYTTGQSGGCMTSIDLNIRYPKLFAASFLVAGQWDALKTTPMADHKLWILVSQDDDKAYPGMDAITLNLIQHGAKVTRGELDGTASSEQLSLDALKIQQQSPNSNIYYTTFKKGSVIPAGVSAAGGQGHKNTWHIAYNINSIQDWIFQQHQ